MRISILATRSPLSDHVYVCIWASSGMTRKVISIVQVSLKVQGDNLVPWRGTLVFLFFPLYPQSQIQWQTNSEDFISAVESVNESSNASNAHSNSTREFLVESCTILHTANASWSGNSCGHSDSQKESDPACRYAWRFKGVVQQKPDLEFWGNSWEAHWYTSQHWPEVLSRCLPLLQCSRLQHFPSGKLTYGRFSPQLGKYSHVSKIWRHYVYIYKHSSAEQLYCVWHLRHRYLEYGEESA